MRTPLRAASAAKRAATQAIQANPVLTTVAATPPPPNPPKPATPDLTKDVTKLRLNHHCFYYETTPPTPLQLQSASTVFKKTHHSPIKMWSAAEFRTIPRSDVPEVAFLGRSNVGKSSLLNAVMQDQICRTSSKPGRTREMNAYGIGGRKGGEARVVLVDTPGYGQASHEEWGREILKFLTKRRQLRRAFILIDSLHGIKSTDAALLSLLRESAIPHQIILSKVDSILLSSSPTTKPKPSKSKSKSNNNNKNNPTIPQSNITALEEFSKEILSQIQPAPEPGPRKGQVIRDGPPALGEVLSCSSRMRGVAGAGKDGKGFLGVDAVRWAILKAAGLEGSV
ncbi:hypothetical protein FQN55_009322 [Onygenales sp. PD_40]|nr:hypothetical protein FQN55_009322 [Onygenales sp. PD_40]